METTIQQTGINLKTSERDYSHTVATTTEKETVIGNPENYYGVIAITLMAGSMLGGVVAYFVLAYNANNFLFALNVIAAMTNNVAAIAQVPYKTALNIFYITSLINVLVLGIILIS